MRNRLKDIWRDTVKKHIRKWKRTPGWSFMTLTIFHIVLA
jgi:hypothetical protein